MMQLVNELSAGSSEQAEAAMAAFIAVRKKHVPKYASIEASKMSLNKIISVVTEFVSSNSEGGRRAQAVAAGLVDVYAGSENVLSGKINDPSRKFPGDICVLSTDLTWQKCFEVRDKPVRESDVIIFARKCAAMGVSEAAVVMTSPKQVKIDLSNWAEKRGIGLTLFYGWSDLAIQSFFWSEISSPEAAIFAVKCIYSRLKEVEVKSSSIEEWISLTS